MNISADFPPVLYVPCIEETLDPADATVRLRTTRDGRTALLVYSALDRLRSGVGSDAAWMVIPIDRLVVLNELTPFDLVLLDVVVPEAERLATR